MKTLTKTAKMRQVQREIKRHIKFDLEPMLMERARDMVSIANESWLDKEDDTILKKIIKCVAFTNMPFYGGSKNNEVNCGSWEYIEHLELKPLSQISDEDAIEVAKMYSNNRKINVLREEKKYHCSVIDCFEGKIHICNNNVVEVIERRSGWTTNIHPFTIKVGDYLRSKGYALPWNGK